MSSMPAMPAYGSSSGALGPYTVEDLHNSPDDGKGLELWNGWLIEKMSPAVRHGNAAANLRWILAQAAKRWGADVVVQGGEFEFAIGPGRRKPDVWVLHGDAYRAALGANETAIDPTDLLLVAEVVSPRSGSEAHDRWFKREDYAKAGIPQYWIVDYLPVPRIEALQLNTLGTYESAQVAVNDEPLTITKPFEVTVVPASLLEPPQD
jgi:Uma2 family endonuclease